MRPVVAIVGRPNVGKSTLFNRLIGRRKSIVEDSPSITRDRVYGVGSWLDYDFVVIDTGGLEVSSGETLKQKMRAQAELAIEEAGVILFMVDGRTGPTSSDREVAELLRRTGKRIILVVNKIDSVTQEENEYDFYELGITPVFSISALHGRSTGDLLDEIVSAFGENGDEVGYPEGLRLAIIGRPNAGKSSLVNSILGTERVIVSEEPGTTREAVDSFVSFSGRDYVLIDTAGLRRRSRIRDVVEKYSTMRAIEAIERCHLALMIIDCTEGLTEQDKRIAGLTKSHGRGLILVVSKWDLAPEYAIDSEQVGDRLQQEMRFVSYAPIVFTSALEGTGVLELLETASIISEERAKRIPTGRLNQVIDDAIAVNEPPMVKGKRLRIYYAYQSGVNPPRFDLLTNDPDRMTSGYRRYLENALRESFTFYGTPILIRARERRR